MHLCWVLAHTWASKHKQKVPLLVPHVGPLCCSLQAVRFCPVLAVEAESRAKDEVVSACSSAVTVFDKVLVISGAEWGSLVEEGEDRWGRVSCSMGSGVSPSPHLPSASSFQTCIGRFFSWFYLDTTYIDGDFSIEKQISRTTEHLKHLPISSGYWKHSKPAQCEVSWSQLGLWPEAFMGRYPESE